MLRIFMLCMGLLCLLICVQNFWQFTQDARPLDLYVGVFTGAVGVLVVAVNLTKKDE